jgi:hypothetical protein
MVGAMPAVRSSPIRNPVRSAGIARWLPPPSDATGRVKILTIGRHDLGDTWLKLQRGSNFNVISSSIIAPAI